MRKIFTSITAIALFGMISGMGFAYAGEIDILLQKLVEKGVLTAGEAQQIGTETKEQIKADTAAGKNYSLPAWVQNTKLKGDFRLRYQYNHAKASVTDQQRGRFRLRAGLESKVNEKLLVGFGLASGKTGDPRSTNQSLTDSSDKKTVIIDYAYAQYSPLSWATLIGGKMKNPLWEPGDMVWDTDITPEGGVLALAKKINSRTELFLNTGVFVIDEQSSCDHDPMFYAVQPGIKYGFSDTVSLKTAFSYYNFSNIKGNALDYGGGTNTKKPGSSTLYRWDYSAILPAAELGIKEPFKALNISFLNIPFMSVFSEYVYNSSIADNNSGYMLGCKLGAEKVEGRGQWQIKYNFARLEKDAVPDILPDSDRYSGKTNMRAHEFILDYGLGKNTWLSFDCYRAQSLAKPNSPETVVQMDWNMKF
ncbi:MAG: putative porin [Candidatus Omnitrophota bacterium]|jgi:hypothetical protein